MEEEKHQTYILFENHTQGLKMHHLLKRSNIKHTIVPTPRQLSISCGISIMVDPALAGEIERVIEENPDVQTLGIHTIPVKRKSLL